MGLEIFTIGHSNGTLDELVAMLKAFSIERLVDIRRFPGSRRLPHFNRESLEKRLPQEGIEYLWMESLGGRRSHEAGKTSINSGLRSPGFRNYADYMLTEDFENAIKHLLELAAEKRTAIMCAEKLYWRCHRMLISDFLTAQAVKVIHIMDSGKSVEHKLSEMAAADKDGKVTYPPGKQGGQTLFDL